MLVISAEEKRKMVRTKKEGNLEATLATADLLMSKEILTENTVETLL